MNGLECDSRERESLSITLTCELIFYFCSLRRLLCVLMMGRCFIFVCIHFTLSLSPLVFLMACVQSRAPNKNIVRFPRIWPRSMMCKYNFRTGQVDSERDRERSNQRERMWESAIELVFSFILGVYPVLCFYHKFSEMKCNTERARMMMERIRKWSEDGLKSFDQIIMYGKHCLPIDSMDRFKVSIVNVCAYALSLNELRTDPIICTRTRMNRVAGKVSQISRNIHTHRHSLQSRKSGFGSPSVTHPLTHTDTRIQTHDYIHETFEATIKIHADHTKHKRQLQRKISMKMPDWKSILCYLPAPFSYTLAHTCLLILEDPIDPVLFVCLCAFVSDASHTVVW